MKWMAKKSILGLLLLLAGQACSSGGNQDYPTPPKAPLNGNLVVLDRGRISIDQGVAYEKHSDEARIYFFTKEGKLNSNILNERNPYHRWGFNASLYPTAEGRELLLISPMLRVNNQLHNASIPAFQDKGRMSILNSSTMDLISAIDFTAYGYEQEVRTFPDEAFAFDRESVYLIHNSAKKTFKIDLSTPEQTRSEVKALDGVIYSTPYIYRGKIYALDQTTLGKYQLMYYDPKSDLVKRIYVGNPNRVITWRDDLLYLSYRDGSIAIFCLFKEQFVLPPTKLHEDLGEVYYALLDQSEQILYLTFNESFVRPNIYRLPLGEVKAGVMPQIFTKLPMETSDDSSGKVRLYIDEEHHLLYTIFFHSQRYFHGGKAHVYKLDEPTAEGKPAKPLREYSLQAELANPIQGYLL